MKHSLITPEQKRIEFGVILGLIGDGVIPTGSGSGFLGDAVGCGSFGTTVSPAFFIKYRTLGMAHGLLPLPRAGLLTGGFKRSGPSEAVLIESRDYDFTPFRFGGGLERAMRGDTDALSVSVCVPERQFAPTD